MTVTLTGFSQMGRTVKKKASKKRPTGQTRTGWQSKDYRRSASISVTTGLCQSCKAVMGETRVIANHSGTPVLCAPCTTRRMARVLKNKYDYDIKVQILTTKGVLRVMTPEEYLPDI